VHEHGLHVVRTEAGLEETITGGDVVAGRLHDRGRRNEDNLRDSRPALLADLVPLFGLRVPEPDRSTDVRNVSALAFLALLTLPVAAAAQPPTERDAKRTGDRDEQAGEGDRDEFHAA